MSIEKYPHFFEDQGRPEKENKESDKKDNEIEKEGGWLKKMIEFQRTKTGKLIKWLTLAGGIMGSVYMYDFIKGRQSREEAWHEFQSKHPDIEQLSYKNLNEVPREDEEHVLKVRDSQYKIRLEEGLSRFTIKGEKQDTVNFNRTKKQLENFSLAEYEKEVKNMNLGSMVDLGSPFPVIEFKKEESLPSGMTYDGEFKDTPKADTIFIDPYSYEGREILKHEYCHSLVSNCDKKNLEESEHILGPESYKSFNEGLADLIRLKINDNIGQREIPGSGYEGETFSVHMAEQLVGKEKFWENVKQGRFDEIKKAIDGKLGEDTFELMMNGWSGLAGLLNSRRCSADQAVTYQKLIEKGLLKDEYFKKFADDCGFWLQDPSEFVVFDSRKNPFGVIKLCDGHLNASFINPDQKMLVSFSENPALNKWLPSFNELPNGVLLSEKYRAAKDIKEFDSVKNEIAKAVEEYIKTKYHKSP